MFFLVFFLFLFFFFFFSFLSNQFSFARFLCFMPAFISVVANRFNKVITGARCLVIASSVPIVWLLPVLS